MVVDLRELDLEIRFEVEFVPLPPRVLFTASWPADWRKNMSAQYGSRPSLRTYCMASVCALCLPANGAPFDERACRVAASRGHLPCLAYAREHGAVWGEMTVAYAARAGHLECLRYAHEHTGYAQDPRRRGWEMDDWTCGYAAAGGHLECLRYAHENGCPFAAFTCEVAAGGGHAACLRYAVLNGASASGCLAALVLRWRLALAARALRGGLQRRHRLRALLALQLTPDARDCDRHLLQRLVLPTFYFGGEGASEARPLGPRTKA